MAMTTPAIYNTGTSVGAGGGSNPMQRSTLSRTSFSLGTNSMAMASNQRKSAVELLAETKAFYVKSETVRGRTQTLPLLSHNRNRDRTQRISNPTTDRFNLQNSTCQTSLDMTRPSGISTLNRRSTGSSGTLTHQSNADMLQNALRKLLDCSSPITSLENVATNSNSVSTDLNYDIDCTTPISPPAEYAFCGTASERRYTTRSLSQSQPVSASSTRSGGNSHIHENGCCSAHLVVLAKSLPDLHTARNLSSSYEGSRSNKSATSDVFSLNRDSGGDSSGHLTHRSEPAPQHRQVTSHTTPNEKQWPGGATLAASDLRRDSGSSTQHSGSYYHNSPYYDCKHIYDSKIAANYIISSSGRSYDVHKSGNFENKNNYNAHFSPQDIPKTSGGYYEKNSPSSFHENDIYNRLPPTSGYYCRVSKHGYPVPMSVARTEIVQTSNDQRTVTQNVRNYEKVRDNKKVHSSKKSRSSSHERGHAKLRPAPLVYDSASSGELILPPPIECCDNFQPDNSTFIDTIIPPPVFEVENEIYESLETKNLGCDNNKSETHNETCCGYNDNYKPPNTGDLKILECIRGNHDNISDISFHENVAPAVTQKSLAKGGVYSPRKDVTANLLAAPLTLDNDLGNVLPPPPSEVEGPMSLPFVDPELSPGPGTFKRQKGFRFKNKSTVGTNGRPILRSKSDISDRYRRHSKQNQTGSVVRKSTGGEISRSVSHLEQFFEQLGLNSDAYENLFVKSGSSETDSPVYFSDVSTVDSNRPISQVDSNEGCTAGAGGTGGIGTGPLAPILRSSEPTSIVERNARIIKWMCNCRKAQLAGSSQGK